MLATSCALCTLVKLAAAETRSESIMVTISRKMRRTVKEWVEARMPGFDPKHEVLINERPVGPDALERQLYPLDVVTVRERNKPN